jgi:hypothetical protein
MKTIFALVALAFSTVASSACFLIYTPSNELVWRSNTPPVSMDKLALDDEVNRLVPKGHLVIVDTAGMNCPNLDLTTRTTMRQIAEKIKYD